MDLHGKQEVRSYWYLHFSLKFLMFLWSVLMKTKPLHESVCPISAWVTHSLTRKGLNYLYYCWLVLESADWLLRGHIVFWEAFGRFMILRPTWHHFEHHDVILNVMTSFSASNWVKDTTPFLFICFLYFSRWLPSSILLSRVYSYWNSWKYPFISGKFVLFPRISLNQR